MTARTKLAALAVLALVLLGLALALPRVRQALGVAVVAVGSAVALAARLARQAWRQIIGQAGPVEGAGDPWIPDPAAPERILVEAHGETVSVKLPPGIDRDHVRAVVVGEGGQAATVEVIKW